MKPKNARARVELLGRYDPQGELIIEDPYYVSLKKKKKMWERRIGNTW